MKNYCEDFLSKLDDLIHDHIDDQLRHLSINEFKLQKELMEEALAKWLFEKFLKERHNVKDNS